MSFFGIIRFVPRLAYHLRSEQSRQCCHQLGFGHGYVCVDGTTCFQCPSSPIAHSVFQDMAFSGQGRRELKEFLDLAAGCRSFVDVGASGGFFSVLFVASRSAASTVLSIEPDPGARQVLIDTRNRNSREMVKWEIDPRAVMSHTGSARFVSSGYGAEVLSQLALGNANKCAAENNLQSKIFEVSCTTLPALLSKYSVQPQLIKIDIESYEYELVQSSLDIFQLWKPRIMLELHVALLRARGKDPKVLLESLSSIGYRRFRGYGRKLSNLPAEADSAGVLRTGLIFRPG